MADQLNHPLGITAGKPEPFADFSRHFGTDFNVVVKPDALPNNKGARLTHIVQQYA